MVRVPFVVVVFFCFVGEKSCALLPSRQANKDPNKAGELQQKKRHIKTHKNKNNTSEKRSREEGLEKPRFYYTRRTQPNFP